MVKRIVNWFSIISNGLAYLRIGSCLAWVYRVMDARGKFGEHERSVRVARGAAESNSSFLSVKRANSFITWRQQLCSLN